MTREEILIFLPEEMKHGSVMMLSRWLRTMTKTERWTALLGEK